MQPFISVNPPKSGVDALRQITIGQGVIAFRAGFTVAMSVNSLSLYSY
jgi:hypothetical protein